MDYQQFVHELRAERKKGAESDTAFARELADVPAPIVSEKLRQRRAARHDSMAERARGPLLELEQSRRSLVRTVPGLGGGLDAARKLAALQREYNKTIALPDPTTLARTPLRELTRQASAATTPAVVAEFLRELEFRAESDDNAKTDSVLLGRHLSDCVDNDPQVARSIELFHDYGRYADSITATLRATRDGEPDPGEQWDLYPQMRELKAAGIPSTIHEEPDGSASLHVARGAGGELKSDTEWLPTER
jgi:hypothetical protein